MGFLPRADRVALLELIAFLTERVTALARIIDALPDDLPGALEVLRGVRGEMQNLHADTRKLLDYDTASDKQHDTA